MKIIKFNKNFYNQLETIIEKRKRPASLNVTIDVDPINFT